MLISREPIRIVQLRWPGQRRYTQQLQSLREDGELLINPMVLPRVLLLPLLFGPALPNWVDAQELPVERLFEDGLETFAPDVLRLSRLELRDPHLFAQVIICADVTAAFNDQIDSNINSDADGDGFLDASPLLLMEPFAPPLQGRMVQTGGICSAPATTAECLPIAPGPARPFEVRDSTLCRAALPGTISGYQPSVPSINGPCFTDSPQTAQQSLNGLMLELQQASLAGSYTSTAPDRIESGLLRGFIRETDADLLLIPADVPLIGGQPLSALLPGGAGNCAAGDDRDTLDGQTGWWFYFSIQAERVARG